MTPPSESNANPAPDDGTSIVADGVVGSGRALLSRVAAHLQNAHAAGTSARGRRRDVDVADLRQLHQATMRAARRPERGAALREILESALAAIGAERGLFSLVAAESDGLTLEASAGLSAECEEWMGRARTGSAACAACWQRRERVVVEDASTDPLFAEWREAIQAGAFRSSHSVPLLAADGRVLGVLTALLAEPHGPDPRERCLLDLYAEMAATQVERLQAEEKLRAREAQLRLVSGNAPVVLSHWSRDHRLLFASRAFAERWKTTPEMLLGRSVAEILGEEAWELIRPYLNRVAKGEAVSFEMEIPYQEIGRRYMHVSYTPDLDESGRMRSYLSVVTDITDRRRAELALRESEERLRLATQMGKVGLWDWDVVANRVTWTESLYAIHGVRRENFEATVEGFAKLVHPDDAEMVSDAIRRSLETGDRYELEFRIVRPDADVGWVFTSAVVLRDRERPIRMLGATLDVTARKRAELALRESEEKFRALARHAPVGIFMTNLRGGWLFVNENGGEMAGMSAEEAAGDGWIKALHPDDRGRVVAEWQAALAERRPFALEFRFLRPDGRVSWVHGSAVEFRDAQGEVIGRIGTVAEITERKAAEFALQQSERRFRTLANRAPVGIFMTDPQGETVFVNETWCALSGLKAEQAMGRGWLEAVHPEDRGRVFEGWCGAVGSGAASSAEYRFLRPDGSVAWVQGNATQLRDAGGRVSGYVGTIADFTQRKEAEVALRASEARYRQLVQMLPVAVYTCDGEGRIDLFNEAAVALWGRLPANGVERWSGAHRMFDRTGAPLAPGDGPLASVLAGAEDAPRVELILEQPDGMRRHVLANPHAIRDEAGNIVGAVNALIDITEHRIAEDNAGFLNRLSQELAAHSDPEQIMRDATRTVGSYFGAHRCYFFEGLGDHGRVTVGADWSNDGAPSVAGQYQVDRLGESKWWRALRRGVLAVGDIETHPLTREEAAHYRAWGIRGFVAAPVLRGGRWVAALTITTAQPRRWREDELALLGNVATLVWPMIERARAETALQAHAQQLEQKIEQRTASLREAIAQMEEFSYSVSHDLRSPLRAMNAYAEALAEDYGAHLDATARDYLERIRRSSVRMEKLTHDVLTYSRIARDELQLAPVQVERLLRDLVDQYAELQPGAADVSWDAPHAVLAHESSLGQCIGNLLTNAAKFVRAGQRPTIRITTEERGDRVRINVRDEGIGIPPQYHAALFQVFERVPTRARYEGTGIGLAIVRKAAEKMGGRCGVESDGEHGSLFWVELEKA